MATSKFLYPLGQSYVGAIPQDNRNLRMTLENGNLSQGFSIAELSATYSIEGSLARFKGWEISFQLSLVCYIYRSRILFSPKLQLT